MAGALCPVRGPRLRRGQAGPRRPVASPAARRRGLRAHAPDRRLGAVAVRRGLGIGYLPYGLVAGELGHGLVEIAFNGWRPLGRELYALYPASRQLSPKVRALIDFALAARAAHG
ncbi:LysR substrate-binding domain-containing protein [Arenibaculum sp.]|uniref:LysR substrate-binding domain-containing protein n=1 Tax=Arenibaculum sp. TaxID=2865862 RepID=UPI0039C89911